MFRFSTVSRRKGFLAANSLAAFSAIASPAWAEEAPAAAAAAPGSGIAIAIWVIAFVGSLVALFFAYRFFQMMIGSDPGNERMQEIAGYVREGANAYLRQQYMVVAAFFVVIVIILSIFAFVLEVQSHWVPFAFLTGGFFSGLAGWIGMKTATLASNRTAAGAQKSLNAGLLVAFRSGAVMGLTVVGLGLLDITLWFALLYWGVGLGLTEITVTMLCFGMGASAGSVCPRRWWNLHQGSGRWRGFGRKGRAGDSGRRSAEPGHDCRQRGRQRG